MSVTYGRSGPTPPWFWLIVGALTLYVLYKAFGGTKANASLSQAR